MPKFKLKNSNTILIVTKTLKITLKIYMNNIPKFFLRLTHTIFMQTKLIFYSKKFIQTFRRVKKMITQKSYNWYTKIQNN